MLKSLLVSAAVAAMAFSASAEKTVLWTAEAPEGEPIEGWHDFLVLSAEEAAILNAGDEITVTVTSKGTTGWPQVGLFEGNVGWPPMTNAGAGDCPCDLKLSITYDMAEKIHANGATIKGESVYVSEISFESSPIKVGPNTVWFGPKQCAWGDAISISKEVLANVTPYDKIELEYDKEAAEHTIQFLFGGWSGANIPTYEAWKTNFLIIDEEAGVMNLTLLPELDHLSWGPEGEEKEYDLFTLLKDGGLIMQGPCLVNQVIYLPNGQLYNKVIESIDEMETKYNDAIKEIAGKYPDFSSTGWDKKIGGAIDQAKSGALQAVLSANENRELFDYSFDSGEIENMIAEMKTTVERNQAAYNETLAKIDESEKEYKTTIDELMLDNPEFDFKEWKELFEFVLNDARKSAKKALNTAYENTTQYDYAYDGKEVKALLAELREDVKTSGVASVEAADNACYYDLHGNKISNPKAGMFIKVVEGKVSKVAIK